MWLLLLCFARLWSAKLIENLILRLEKVWMNEIPSELTKPMMTSRSEDDYKLQKCFHIVVAQTTEQHGVSFTNTEPYAAWHIAGFCQLPLRGPRSSLCILIYSQMRKVWINTDECTQTHHPGSVHVRPNMTSRVCLETASGLVRSYSARIKRTSSGCGWKEARCQTHYRSVPTRFWHISKPSGWQTSHHVMLIFLLCITVGLRINDSDFDRDFVTPSRSYAAFQRSGRMCCKPPTNCSSAQLRERMRCFTCMCIRRQTYSTTMLVALWSWRAALGAKSQQIIISSVFTSKHVSMPWFNNQWWIAQGTAETEVISHRTKYWRKRHFDWRDEMKN